MYPEPQIIKLHDRRKALRSPQVLNWAAASGADISTNLLGLKRGYYIP